MKKFKVEFVGRTKGAIGITYKITDEFECATEQVGTMLYSKYEHISQLRVNGEYLSLDMLQFKSLEP